MKTHTYQVYGSGVHEYEVEPLTNGDFFSFRVRVYCVMPFTRSRRLIATEYTTTQWGTKFVAKRAVRRHRRRCSRSGYSNCFDAVSR